jgi:hypothetical protein
MSAPFKIIARQALVAPLGLRFRDAATGAPVTTGLRVELYPTANPARRTEALVNGSGVYVAHRAAGLPRVTAAGADAPAQNPSPPTGFTVEVTDAERRYLPYSFPVTLPSKGLHKWTWPLAEASARPSAEPAAAFADDFADNARAPVWKLGTLNTPASVFDAAVVVAEQGGRLEVTPLTNAAGKHYNGYVSVAGWNLTDARASVAVVRAADGAAQTFFTLAADANNWLRFQVEAGRLNFQTRVGGAETSPSVAYVAAEHRFWRLRHERRDDQLFFETSADGAAWVARRTLARPFALTSLVVELGAGTAAKAPAPGKAAFDNFRMESNPTPALPLFSAPSREAGGGLAAVRATLWDAAAGAPAAWALMEVRVPGQPTVRGLADREGRVALVFPYPEPAAFAEQSPPPPAGPFSRHEWPLQLFASYAPRRPAPPRPSLPAALAQPRATLWADAARTVPLTRATLRAGQELVVRSFEAPAASPPGNTPLPVLLITPAG